MASKRLAGLLSICLAIAANSVPLGPDAPPPIPREVEMEVSAPLPTEVKFKSAPVAVLYSPATRASQGWRWDWEWSGCGHALDALGVEYEVLSPEQLETWDGRVLILPNVRNLSAATVKQIEGKKCKVLATYMSSYRSESNEPWPENNFALSDLLGVDFKSWVGSGEQARQLKLGESLGKREMPLGRGLAMLVKPRKEAKVLAEWSGGEAAIVQSAKSLYVGEDLFCPENSDSKPVLALVSKLLNRLEPGLAQTPSQVTFSDLPAPPSTDLATCGRTVKVGVGRLEGETLLRAPRKLVTNGKSKLKFHRWTPGRELEVSGQPFVEVLRLRENGTYRWSAYRGTLQISKEGDLVNVLDFEEYLAGVVPSEVPSYFPKESLKAMAVVARTYGLSHLGRHRDYDVCDTVHCQVYQGLGQESKATNLAVGETTGELLTYRDQPVNALFHAVCGGTTASSVEAWPGGTGRPYLTSQDDGKFCSDSGRYRWQVDFHKDQLTESFRTALEATRGTDFHGFSSVLDMRVEERSPSGRVRVLSLESPEGIYSVEGDAIRWLFSGGKISTAGLQSTLFEIEKREDGYRIKGGGWGHGVGLCQQGSSGRALAGQSYSQILHHYYPHTDLIAWSDWEKRTAERIVEPAVKLH